MFTGIIEQVGKVCTVRKKDDGIQLEIESRTILAGLKVDNSIAVNGTCLTIVRRKQNIFAVDAVKETLSKTSLGRCRSEAASILNGQFR